MLSACENVRKWRVCKPGMHGSPGRTGTLLEGQRGGVDGSDWNHRVLRGDHLCGAAWLLNRPEHTKDPREDEEQMEYLREWSEKHGKANRKE